MPLDGSNPRSPITLAFNTLYFGLPILKADGNNISYELAQTLTVNAVKLAESEALQAFKNGFMEDAIRVVYMTKLKTEMATFGGRVNDSPGLNITVPDKDIVTATYPTIFGLSWGCF